MTERPVAEADAVGRSDAAPDSPRSGRGEVLTAQTGSVEPAPDAAVQVTVYVVTGRHGRVTIPESFCRECHMFARRADAAAERVDATVDVRVVSWWTHLPWALLRGGYHPPVLTVDGSRLCQGHDVPPVEEVVAAIREALGD